MPSGNSPPQQPTWTIVNLCNYPPWVIASQEFNEEPKAIHLTGVREANRFFFDKIRGIEDPLRCGEILNEYMSVKFQLHEWRNHQASARKSLRNSYLRFLRGWGFDSNSREGAVLKSWVESRFGIRPTYHRGKLLGINHEDDHRFALDRMKGMARTNAINFQLDLLYEFCQEELARRYPDTKWTVLYRGTYDMAEYEVLDRGTDRRLCVRLNNLSSFTSNHEYAWEFGSKVWKVNVPLAKIFFFSDLLPKGTLRGEDEYLVLGGEYWVEELIF